MTADAPLTSARIFRFYFPLALSWLFMSIEAPVSIGLISRLPDAKLQTAAFLMLMGLALWIESPVIDLLSTSTTLCTDRAKFRVINQFAWLMMAWCTVVHGLVTLTPLYGVITDSLLHLPGEVAGVLRVPLTIMIPWSACIGWRRFRQGILIRSGLTRAVGLGTAVRMTTMAVVGVSLFLSKSLSGTETAAVSLIASVLSEALFVHFISLRAVAALPPGASASPVTLRDIFKFHMPLTATTMLTLSTGPIIGAALAQSGDAVLAMAAWQVSSTLVWMHRTIVFALPEAVITLYRGPESIAKLRSFCVWVGVGSSGFMALTWLVRGDLYIFSKLLGTSPDTALMAHVALGLCILFPFIGALQSYAKGTLTVHRRTMPRLVAMVAGMSTLLIGLTIGVVGKYPGVIVAALAMTAALVAEWAVLAGSNVKTLRSHTDTLV